MQNRRMFLLQRSQSYGANVPKKENVSACCRDCRTRYARVGKRLSSVIQGDLTEQRIETPKTQTPAAEGSVTGERPLESLGISSMNVNTLENGFSRDLLYFDGTLQGKKVRILVDGGSMGDFVASDV